MTSPRQLSPMLFWDIDISRLDWDKHRLLIVERVIERGSYLDFRSVEKHYGRYEMKQIIKDLPWLHTKDIAFVHAYFGIPYNDLKCFSKKRPGQNYLS